MGCGLISVSCSNIGKICTAKNNVISPDFLVWKFCGKTQFPHSFRRFARNYAETVPFRKIFTARNQVKLRYFSQCLTAQLELFLVHTIPFKEGIESNHHIFVIERNISSEKMFLLVNQPSSKHVEKYLQKEQ